MVNQERAQLEEGSVIRGGVNPQYLTLADVSAFLEQEGKNSRGSPSNFPEIPYSHQNSLASLTPRDTNPQSSTLLMERTKVLWNT